MRNGYHSAHLAPVEGIEPLDRYDAPDGSAAFVWDVLHGELPAEYSRCDVLYADLPWRSGFETFNRRAGISDGRTYRAFMDTVSRIVTNANRPMVLVSGKHALDYLPLPAQTVDVKMPGTGQAALAIFYNLLIAPDLVGIYGPLEHLSRAYECVGDFCCGYGNAVRAFAQRGKRFVASDYNPACIGHIAANIRSWRPAHA